MATSMAFSIVRVSPSVRSFSLTSWELMPETILSRTISLGFVVVAVFHEVAEIGDKGAKPFSIFTDFAVCVLGKHT